jgi:hypothetical protein
MAWAENRSWTRWRRTRGSSSPARSTAAAISSTEDTTTPVWPSATTSGTEPLPQAITGVPQAMASVMTSPNGSGHWIGNNNAAAPANSSAFSCCETSSRTSTSSPNSGSTRSAQ